MKIQTRTQRVPARQSAESVVGPSRIQAELTGEPPARALCERSKAAGMVVLGSHGHGGLPGLQLGSVPWKVATHGHGRIVIVRGKWRSVNQSPGPVAAGVDGSPASQDTLTFAFEEAALRGVPLVAVCALADSPGTLGEARRGGIDGMLLGSVAQALLLHSPCPVAVVHPR